MLNFTKIRGGGEQRYRAGKLPFHELANVHPSRQLFFDLDTYRIMQYANEHLLSQPGCTNTRPGQLHAPITQTILTTPAFIDNPLPFLSNPRVNPVSLTFQQLSQIFSTRFKFLSIHFESITPPPYLSYLNEIISLEFFLNGKEKKKEISIVKNIFEQ